MEENGYFPSTLPSLASSQRGAESSCIHSPRISNVQQHSQMSATQFANSNGQVIVRPPIPTRGEVDVGSSEELGVGPPVPFQQNGTLTPDLALHSVPWSIPSHDTTEKKDLSTFVNARLQGSLQTSGNATMTDADLSESLNKIEHLALSTSLFLDACCSRESKRTGGTQLSTTPNLAAVSSVNSLADNNFLQQPRQYGSKLQQPESSSSSIEPDRNKGVSKGSTAPESSDKLLPSQRGVPSASCCECNEPLGLKAPGTELSLAIASVVDNGTDHSEDPHSLLASWTNSSSQMVGSSSADKAVSRKDEMFFRLVQQVRDLEMQLQERKEWAHQKALQAACKFSKDMSELKSLRLEHEEILCLKRDTQALENKTMERLTEMENALRKAGAQVDKANASVRKLETENAELKAEMEAAKLSASESNAKCQEVAKREKKSSKKIQAWEKQKGKMLDDILKQKQEISESQEHLSNVKIQQNEAEMRWRQEEKRKDEALSLANAEKWAREQLEVADKRREETWRRKADANFQRHKDDIERLESELDQLKIAAETSSVELSPGVSLHNTDTSGLQSLKDTSSQLLQELAELQDSRDICRDRECVMCMSEESSVVFLPCAHQIVCAHCNDLHQKQGMRDCPSCRTVIQQRIKVLSTLTVG